MIGIDTIVLVRYVVQDDQAQASVATAMIEGLDEEQPGFVSVVVIVEVYWVLRRAYRATHEQVASVIRMLLDSTEILVQESDAVRRALDRSSPGTDFSDVLIAEFGRIAGCRHTVTLDRAAAKLPQMVLLSV